VHLAPGQVDERAVRAHSPGAAHLDAVHRHVEQVRVEGGTRRADGGQDPTPVGVVAEDGALEEVVACDGAGNLEGIGLGRSGPHLEGDVVVGALGISDQLAREGGAHLGDGGGQLVGRRGDARGTGRHQQDGVVGGHAPVGIDSVKGGRRRSAEHGIQIETGDIGIRGEDDEHGGQRRREHARTLGHAPHAPPITRHLGDFGHGVGRHDGGRGSRSALVGERRDGKVDPVGDLVHRQQFADQARRTDRDVAGARAQRLGDELGSAVRVLEALMASAGIGPAGVEEDRVHAPVGHDVPGPGHGGRLDAIRREDGGGVEAGAVVDHQGDIGSATGLEAGGHAGGAEALGCGDAHAVLPNNVVAV